MCVCSEDTRGLHQSLLQQHLKGPLCFDLPYLLKRCQGTNSEGERLRALPHHPRCIDRLITVALQPVINTTGVMEAVGGGGEGGGDVVAVLTLNQVISP